MATSTVRPASATACNSVRKVRICDRSRSGISGSS